MERLATVDELKDWFRRWRLAVAAVDKRKANGEEKTEREKIKEADAAKRVRLGYEAQLAKQPKEVQDELRRFEADERARDEKA